MPKTVLLADDSVTIQHAVGISLANEDIALVNVNNGEDAVIRARAIKPDLILLDVVMPKVSGYEACKHIRQDPSIKHTPIIMLVGAIEGFDEQKFKESMANDYIIKPFESGALINKVRKYLYPELSRTIPPTQLTATPPVPIATPPPVVPQTTSSFKTNPQIPIPPKPAIPPVVPPVIPLNTQFEQPKPPISTSTQSPSTQLTTPQTQKEPSIIPSFTENLITPPIESMKKTETQEAVDEISPQDIEEITSEIPELKQSQGVTESPTVVDIVSQVEQAMKSTTQENTTPIQPPTETKIEEPKPFDMEEWGKDLKKEIMEASGVNPPLSEEVKPVEMVAPQSPTTEIEKDQISLPDETQPPMQIVSIAESISTEPVGEPTKPVEIPTIESNTRVQVEPTSLVENKIDLCSPLSEEAIKQVREIVERVVWEIVPELAEKLIKEEIKRLMSEEEK